MLARPVSMSAMSPRFRRDDEKVHCPNHSAISAEPGKRCTRAYCQLAARAHRGERIRMLTFRIAITAAVMAFIAALAACLIFIQIATFHVAARAAAAAAMDAASANTLSRFEADVSELGSLVRVLSSNPALANSDDRSEVDDAIVLFKAALRQLPQT